MFTRRCSFWDFSDQYKFSHLYLLVMLLTDFAVWKAFRKKNLSLLSVHLWEIPNETSVFATIYLFQWPWFYDVFVFVLIDWSNISGNISHVQILNKEPQISSSGRNPFTSWKYFKGSLKTLFLMITSVYLHRPIFHRHIWFSACNK